MLHYLHLLTIVFIILKLTGYIATWSWFCVLLPSIVSVFVALCIIVFAFIVAIKSS
jgi:hypothetical protein